MKFILTYNNCLGEKLNDELIASNVYPVGMFVVKGNDAKNPTAIKFKDIEVTTNQSEGEEPVTTYQKCTKETVVIDEEGNTKEVDKWVDYTHETLDLIAEIDGIVAVHDPTPVVETAKLQDDKMIELILKATTLEELQLELLSERYGI